MVFLCRIDDDDDFLNDDDDTLIHSFSMDRETCSCDGGEETSRLTRVSVSERACFL